MKLNPRRTAAILLFLSASFPLLPAAQANSPVFVYTNRDLMVCFRKTGANGGTTGPNDLEVNIGQASIYYNAAPGSTNLLSGVSPSQINTVFDSLNNLSWSVGGCVPTVGDTGDPSVPTRTLWVTAPRLDPTIQAAPWVRNGPTTQGTTAGEINSILVNASFYSGTVSASANNATNLVLVPAGSGHEYGAFMGTFGNYLDTFQGEVESTTASDFASVVSGPDSISRSDLYELRPDSTGTQPAGKYLGYFELDPVGTLSFVAAGGVSTPPAPVLSITYNNNVSAISFSSAFGATYTLYYKNAAGLLTPGGWSSSPATLTGNGSTLSFQDSTTDPNRFYRVGAH
jgi:hypothetical protein